MRILKNGSLCLFLLKKNIWGKGRFFWQKPWTNPFAKCRFFSTMLELHFLGLKSILFYPDDKKCFFLAFFAQENGWANGLFFEKNHGPTPLENVHFLKVFRTYLAWSKKDSFLSRITKNVFFCFCLLKKNIWEKGRFFWQTPWTNPFAKCRFF